MVALHNDDDDKEAPLLARNAGAPRLALVRCDTLPEDAVYRDTGCDLAPSCLNCPLPRCKYDVPRSARRLGNCARDREIAVLRRKYDAPIAAIAVTFAISRRQVFRILREERERKDGA
ncbi:MAG: hypothetical protein WD359_01380 [Dehalococcoidia bacterium]